MNKKVLLICLIIVGIVSVSAQKKSPKIYALCIGIDKFKNNWCKKNAWA